MTKIKAKIDNYEKLTGELLELINDKSKHLKYKDFIRTSLSLRNPISKHSYSGGNVMNTLMHKLNNDYDSFEFVTYKQAKDNDLKMIKGSKACPVYYYKMFEKENADKEKSTIPIMKRYSVFNLDCFDLTDEQKEKYLQVKNIDLETVKSDNEKLELLKKLARIKMTTTGRAFYMPSSDFIHMPSLDLFENDLNFWNEVFLHELTHWTGNEKRLDRKLKGKQSSESYSKEELIAELGSFFLCLDLGIDKNLESGASYLRGYLKSANSKDLFEAMNKATTAIKYLYEQIGVLENESIDKN